MMTDSSDSGITQVDTTVIAKITRLYSNVVELCENQLSADCHS